MKSNLIQKIDEFNNSPKGKVVKSIFLLFFSMVMVATATLAWFFSNTSTTSAGMTMTVSGEVSYVEYTAYYIKDLDTKEVIKGEQSIVDGVNMLSVSLLPYDVTFTAVNQYAPIVIRAVFEKIENKYIPAANETKHLSVVVTRNGALDDGDGTILDDVFSSIGQVASYTSAGLALNATNKTIHDTLVAQYRADNNPQTFTTLQNNDTYTKVNSISMDLAYTLDNFEQNTQGESCLVVYLVLDYNSELTALFTEQASSAGTNVNAFDQQFEVGNDLSNINIQFAEV